MFNQIQISLTDRVYHRFLWRDNLSVKYPSDFQWKRLPFGDRPAPDLSISALHFLGDKHSREIPVASSMIKHHSYVDDLASSFFYYYYWHIYPPITRKRRSAARARLGVAGHLSTTLRWGNPVKCLSQRHNNAGFLHTVP